jgi:spore coat protein U-like protein
MKKTLILLTIIAVGVFLGAPSFAGDTGQVNINATVVGTCKFTATGGSTTINVTLDPSSGLDVTGSGSLQFWCTKGASYSVSDNDGLYESGPDQNRVSNGTEYIPYSFSYNPTSGTGSGPTSPITLNVSATFAYTDYSGASAGTYSDTVTITVNP